MSQSVVLPMGGHHGTSGGRSGRSRLRWRQPDSGTVSAVHGLDAGIERAAASYCLVETARIDGLDPEDYLRQVLERIPGASDQPHRRVAALKHRPALHAPERGKMAA